MHEGRDFNEAFVVYVKHDALAHDALRGHVDNVASGRRQYFGSVDELVAFFRDVARHARTSPLEEES